MAMNRMAIAQESAMSRFGEGLVCSALIASAFVASGLAGAALAQNHAPPAETAAPRHGPTTLAQSPQGDARSGSAPLDKWGAGRTNAAGETSGGSSSGSSSAVSAIQVHNTADDD